jgi:hypothetical protein
MVTQPPVGFRDRIVLRAAKTGRVVLAANFCHVAIPAMRAWLDEKPAGPNALDKI